MPPAERPKRGQIIMRPEGNRGMETAQTQAQTVRGRLIFLNALPLNAFNGNVHLDVIRVTIQELTRWVNERLAEGFEIVHFIRHNGTIQTLRAVGIPLAEAPNAGLYRFQSGDVIVVVTLSSPQRGQEAQPHVEDLAFWIVEARPH